MLGIGTSESITIPRNFKAKLQKEKLKFVEKARNWCEVWFIFILVKNWMVYLKIFFFSWPIEGCELSSRPKRGISTSEEKYSTTTMKVIILNFSVNVPELYITTLMKRSNSIWLVADAKEVIEEIQTQVINKKKPRAKSAVTNSYRSNAGNI
jgi:hypothetical protein